MQQRQGRSTRAIVTAYAGSIALAAVVPFLTIRFVLANEPIRLEVLLAGTGGIVLALALIFAFRPGGPPGDSALPRAMPQRRTRPPCRSSRWDRAARSEGAPREASVGSAWAYPS